ncbi:MAG: preprotein translocase subunit SecG [Campylobacteraceae bacterium]|jgi:preprotein translocase subunit SecG|nr:preprotein translocase subunit SecG [Campylobacteraceae bacterium]
MSELLFVLEFILAAVITIAVLLQKSSSIGLGVYSGSNESLFGAKGPGGFLAKLTLFVGFLFIVNTILLTYVYNQQSSNSVIESVEPSVPISPAAPSAPAAPDNN